MEDTALFTLLWGIRPPWRVTRVEVTLAAERIDVWVEEAPGTQFPCVTRKTSAPVYDHTAEQIRVHLPDMSGLYPSHQLKCFCSHQSCNTSPPLSNRA